MNKPPYEGIFITLEGGEGAGKSTLAQSLFQEISKKGCNVVQVREPGGTKLGETLRELLLTPEKRPPISDLTELLLFLAARAQHIDEVISPALHQGKIVICDRFNDSSIAYQGSARHLGLNYVEELCHRVCRGIEPDYTLLLDIDPEIGFKRITQSRKMPIDHLEGEKLQFHKEVRQGFLYLADKYPKRITLIDGSLSKEEIFKEAMKTVAPLLKLA